MRPAVIVLLVARVLVVDAQEPARPAEVAFQLARRSLEA